MSTQMHVAFSSLFMGVGMIGGSKYAHHFSSLHVVRAVVPLFVCMSLTCSDNNFSYLSCWFVLTLSRLHSKVKVIGQSSRIG